MERDEEEDEEGTKQMKRKRGETENGERERERERDGGGFWKKKEEKEAVVVEGLKWTKGGSRKGGPRGTLSSTFNFRQSKELVTSPPCLTSRRGP